MGNHYDPNEDAVCAYTERGLRAKEKIVTAPAYEIGWQLMKIEEILRRVETSVIGGEAIDNLRTAFKTLQGIT